MGAVLWHNVIAKLNLMLLLDEAKTPAKVSRLRGNCVYIILIQVQLLYMEWFPELLLLLKISHVLGMKLTLLSVATHLHQ